MPADRNALTKQPLLQAATLLENKKARTCGLSCLPKSGSLTYNFSKKVLARTPSSPAWAKKISAIDGNFNTQR